MDWYDIKYTFFRLPVIKQLCHAWYWLRTHTYNRYHMIDIRFPRNGYNWGWLDRCEGLMFAMFAMLVDFVEKEKAFKSFVDWKGAQCHKDASTEMKNLYHWWKVQRAKDHDAYEALTDRHFDRHPFLSKVIHEGDHAILPSIVKGSDEEKSWQKCNDMKTALEEKDTEMMLRLVKIRHAMWT